MDNYLIGRSAKPKKQYHYNLQSIIDKGGVLLPLSVDGLKKYGDLTGKYFDFEALKPYSDRLFYSEIYKNPTVLLDKTKATFNKNEANQYFICEGITDVLNLITYGYDNEYGVIFRYNLTCLPDIPDNAERVIFISDSDENKNQLKNRILTKYDSKLFNESDIFRKVAMYHFSMDKTGTKDISLFNDNSEIESNEELIDYILANKTHLNKELLRASKTKEVY